MGHAHHFLSRLDRVSYDEVELSLGLYNNAPLVKYILSHAGLPPGAARVAISLDDRNEGPFVIVTREGRFVTCLGRGMHCDVPVVRRWQLDVLAARHEELAACMRPAASMAEHERPTTRLLGKLRSVGPNLSREAFLDLSALQPMLFSRYIQMLNQTDDWLHVARHNLRHVARPRPFEHELMENVWNYLWALQHLSALIGQGEPIEYFERSSPEQLAAVTGSIGTARGPPVPPRERRRGVAHGALRRRLPPHLRAPLRARERRRRCARRWRSPRVAGARPQLREVVSGRPRGSGRARCRATRGATPRSAPATPPWPFAPSRAPTTSTCAPPSGRRAPAREGAPGRRPQRLAHRPGRPRRRRDAPRGEGLRPAPGRRRRGRPPLPPHALVRPLPRGGLLPARALAAGAPPGVDAGAHHGPPAGDARVLHPPDAARGREGAWAQRPLHLRVGGEVQEVLRRRAEGRGAGGGRADRARGARADPPRRDAAPRAAPGRRARLGAAARPLPGARPRGGRGSQRLPTTTPRPPRPTTTRRPSPTTPATSPDAATITRRPRARR